MASLLMPWLRVDRHFGMVPLGVPDDVPVYVIELPGHGRSKNTELLNCTAKGYASYILDVISELEPHSRIILGGYSLGGGLVVNVAALLEQQAAGSAQQRIERMVLIAPVLALTRSFHARLHAPTAEARRELLRATHAYESLGECRAFFEEYCGLRWPRMAEICFVKGMVPVLGLLVHVILSLMLRAFAWARRRDYPPEHFADLIQRLTHGNARRTTSAITGEEEASVSAAWPDQPLEAMRSFVDPPLWDSVSAVFAPRQPEPPGRRSSPSRAGRRARSPSPRHAAVSGAGAGGSIPTLLVVAEDDAICDYGLLKGIARDGHLGSACTFHTVEGAGHIFVPSQLATVLEVCGPVIGAWLGFD